MNKRVLLCLALPAILSGCFWTPATYYEPTSEIGQLYNTGYRSLSSKDGLRVKEDWGWISFSIREVDYDGPPGTIELPSNFARGSRYLTIRIQLYVSEGYSLSLKDKLFRIHVDTGEAREYELYLTNTLLVSKRGGNGWEYSEIEVPFEETSGFVLNNHLYTGTIWLDIDGADTLSLERFAIEVGTDMTVLGPIEFTKKVAVAFNSIV